MTTEKIFIGINNERIELVGAEKDAFIAQRELDIEAQKQKIAEAKLKAEAKSAAEAKLVALGLDLDDLKALGL